MYLTYANYDSTGRLEILGVLFTKLYENDPRSRRENIGLDKIINSNDFEIVDSTAFEVNPNVDN